MDRPACANRPLDRPAQFQYIVGMASKTIETRAHTTKDGRLNLSVDVEVPDADVALVNTRSSTLFLRRSPRSPSMMRAR